MSATITGITEAALRPNIDADVQQKPHQHELAGSSRSYPPVSLDGRNSTHPDTHRARSKTDSLMNGPTTTQEQDMDVNKAKNGVEAITPDMRRREKVVIAPMCFALFLAGWNDGTIGPLLPCIQSVYDVNFAVVSIIFISNCLGLSQAQSPTCSGRNDTPLAQYVLPLQADRPMNSSSSSSALLLAKLSHTAFNRRHHPFHYSVSPMLSTVTVSLSKTRRQMDS